MPVIIEKFDSRKSTESVSDPSGELLFLLWGTEDDAVARALVEATIPGTWNNKVYHNYDIEHRGGGVHDVTVHYGKYEPIERLDTTSTPVSPETIPTGGSSFSFDTTGGTVHITQSKETVNSYKDAALFPGIPDYKGAIGVAGDRVEGTDIIVPQYQWTETHYLPLAAVNEEYINTLFELTGTVNNASFKNIPAGSVLFHGATGGHQRSTTDWEVTFKFAAQPNITGLTIGNIEDIEKKGWEYLWIVYRDSVSNNCAVKIPAYAYVERVYDSADFSLLGIGT